MTFFQSWAFPILGKSEDDDNLGRESFSFCEQRGTVLRGHCKLFQCGNEEKSCAAN